jgi:hypothetical protein
MTDRTTDDDMTRDKRTLCEMSHTNPYTGRVFGDTQTYSRGNTVAADGGEAGSVEEPDDAEDDPERLKDVDHTPPGESDGAQAAYDRGNEDE